MRPRHLTLQAFGPFAGSVEVDFDRLVHTGLFVVAGPTGAGKTSLFDGVCFALYGRLAGHRDRYGDVRSDHAAPACPTEVALDFDAGGERWRVWRHPRQERPKRRGSGTTTAAPKACLQRWASGAWHPVEARWDLVDRRCRQLVGLDADQFQQVVLLPQGRFQEVLNARSADRQALLRTLFGSELYRRGQEALDAQAKALAEQLGATEQHRCGHLASAHRSLQAAVVALQGGDVRVAEGLLPGVGDGDPDRTDVLRRCLVALRSGPVVELDRRRRRASDDATAARDAAGDAVRVRTLLRRRDDLQARWQALEAERSRREDQRSALEQARRASPVQQAADELARCRARLADADARQAESWSAAAAACRIAGIELPVTPDQDAAERAALDAEMRAKLMGDLVELAQDADRLEVEARQAEGAGADARLRHDELVAARSDRADRLLEITGERERLAGLAADHDRRVQALDEARRRAGLVAELASADRALEQAVGQRAANAARIDQLQHRLDQLTEHLDAERLLAKGVETAAADVRWLARQLFLRRRLGRAEGAVAAARDAVVEARARADAAFTQFVQGTAPRLAARLRPGEPCPVCGSAQHPSPASPPAGQPPLGPPDIEQTSRAVTAAEEQRRDAAAALAALLGELGPLASEPAGQLRSRLEEARRHEDRCVAARDGLQGRERRRDLLREQLAAARREHGAIQGRVDGANAQRAELVGALGSGAGRDPEALVAAVGRARDLVSESLDAITGLDALAGQRTALQAQDDDDATELDQLVGACARWAHEAQRCDHRAQELRAQLRAEVGSSSPAELVERARGAADLIARARHDGAARDLAHAACRGAGTRCAQALAAARFATLDDALAAARTPADVEDLEDRVRRWQRHCDETRAGLDALAVEALPAEPPDVEALAARAGAAGDAAAELIELAGQVGAHLDHALACLDHIAESDARHQGVEARARLVRTAAEVVRGRNHRNVTLEAWVLAAHLREVVEHANEHLSVMSGGRYRLAVTDAVADGRAKAGLDLVVDDAFTGRPRPTVSLSGGETFQASLSLALGLADLVTSGRAGLRLDALFIDEGFGSLDADALDQAIDVLDGLRSRGALVGVVTHVESLKHALPVAIEVRPRPDRRGSTVHQAP